MNAHPPATRTASAATPQREAVVTHIRRAIVLGDLQPGEKLREVKLAAELGVSRATLREALNLLVQDGLLVQEPYRGFSISRLDAAALRDIARTRVPLDLIAIRAILDDATGRRLQLVREVWEGFQASTFDPDPLVQHQAHVAFHRGLWAASENWMLLRLWPVIEALTTITLAQDQIAYSDPQRAHDLHQGLVEAILAGDLAQIEDLLRRHTIDSAEELIGRHADRSLGS
ncbi:MAG: GntR family transcriptional regulator [Kineosporiaceae bacterium]